MSHASAFFLLQAVQHGEPRQLRRRPHARREVRRSTETRRNPGWLAATTNLPGLGLVESSSEVALNLDSL